MNYIKIEKDIFLRDEYGVKRHEWVAGELVPSYVYHAVLKTNTVINPEDLPVEPVNTGTQSLHTSMMETKILPEESVTIQDVAKTVEEKPKAKAVKKKAKK